MHSGNAQTCAAPPPVSVRAFACDSRPPPMVMHGAALWPPRLASTPPRVPRPPLQTSRAIICLIAKSARPGLSSRSQQLALPKIVCPADRRPAIAAEADTALHQCHAGCVAFVPAPCHLPEAGSLASDCLRHKVKPVSQHELVNWSRDRLDWWPLWFESGLCCRRCTASCGTATAAAASLGETRELTANRLTLAGRKQATALQLNLPPPRLWCKRKRIRRLIPRGHAPLISSGPPSRAPLR